MSAVDEQLEQQQPQQPQQQQQQQQQQHTVQLGGIELCALDQWESVKGKTQKKNEWNEKKEVKFTFNASPYVPKKEVTMSNEPRRFPKWIAPVQQEEDAIDAVIRRDQNGMTWEKVTITADSGAAESVIPRDLIKSVPIKDNDAARNGVTYFAANGTPIPVYGEQDVHGRDNAGQHVSMKLVCADVKKPLASVAKMVNKGNRVIFDRNGSYIENERTGGKTLLMERNGVYVFDVWVPKVEAKVNELNDLRQAAGFARQVG